MINSIPCTRRNVALLYDNVCYLSLSSSLFNTCGEGKTRVYVPTTNSLDTSYLLQHKTAELHIPTGSPIDSTVVTYLGSTGVIF